VRQSAPGCTTIFILPPSRAALEERLRNRQTDSAAVIARRLHDAVGDMSHYREFGYVVVNDDFDTACRQLESILAGDGEALKADRPSLAPLLADLLRTA
jgi:guanylate kinase